MKQLLRNRLLIVFYLNFCGLSLLAQSSNQMKLSLSYQEVADDRITKMIDNNDTIYKLIVYPKDTSHNGNRAEILINTNNKSNHAYEYSWDFKLNGNYQQREGKFYRIVIGNWLNPPNYRKGETWSDIKGKQQPPVFLRLKKHDAKLFLQCTYGLMNKNQRIAFEMEFHPDIWYHIDAKIYWSTKDDGYAKISINDSSFAVSGPNKYNDVNIAFKMGLYRNYNNQDTTEAVIKNISIAEIEK